MTSPADFLCDVKDCASAFRPELEQSHAISLVFTLRVRMKALVRYRWESVSHLRVRGRRRVSVNSKVCGPLYSANIYTLIFALIFDGVNHCKPNGLTWLFVCLIWGGFQLHACVTWFVACGGCYGRGSAAVRVVLTATHGAELWGDSQDASVGSGDIFQVCGLRPHGRLPTLDRLYLSGFFESVLLNYEIARSITIRVQYSYYTFSLFYM